ncbi:hypothetical protein FBU30_010180 [Linnemannia zychae]|nr:hypothetical protein FBU30_010180 [Linnemannia zychae]
MAQFSRRRGGSTIATLPFLVSLLLTLLSLATQVYAGYSFSTPTEATRWSTGQPGLITVVSTDKAAADTAPSARLLTITLRQGSTGLFGSNKIVATIRDGIQLLVPVGSTVPQVTLSISDWVVPATLSTGSNYFLHLERAKDGFFDVPDKVDSPSFQIVTANATTPTPTPTTTATPTPTPTTTCNDIKEQCAAQSKVFVPASGATPCSCGADIIVPSVVDSSSSSVRATAKTTFQSTGGPTAAFAVLLLVLMTLF